MELGFSINPDIDDIAPAQDIGGAETAFAEESLEQDIESENVDNSGKKNIEQERISDNIEGNINLINKIIEQENNQNKTIPLEKSGQSDFLINDGQEPVKTYSKIIADYIFLLGRLTTQPITDFNGNVIIPKNTVVTAEIVLKAFYHGRLLELTKYSRA